MLVRMVLTLVGVASLVAGALMEWVHGTQGIQLTYRAFYQTDFSSGAPFLQSVGAAVMVIAVLAILGLAVTSGWLTRLAGALAGAAFLLVLVETLRGDVVRSAGDVQVGMWLTLVGGIVLLIGGIVGSGSVVVKDVVP